MKARPHRIVVNALAFPIIFAFRPVPNGNIFTTLFPRLEARYELPSSALRDNRGAGGNRLYIVDAAEPIHTFQRIQRRWNKWGEGRRSKKSAKLAAIEIIEEVASNDESVYYCPPEWNALTIEAKTKLVGLLSWESLSKWDYNMVEMAELTRDPKGYQLCPLLLVGWALLCGPMAQDAMLHSIGAKTGISNSDPKDGDGSNSSQIEGAYRYHFEELKIDPRTVCNFIREVERRYIPDNPYHNNIHAADATQTTHSLIQMMGEQYTGRVDPITIFSILLAAIFHDVGHPGTNNLFQTNNKTELAIKYKDLSILENMHSAAGQSILFGEERRDEWDIFKGWAHDQKVCAQNIMTRSILATDMAHHSSFVKRMDSLVRQVRTLAEEFAEDNTNAKFEGIESQPILSIIARTLDAHDAPHGDSEDSDSSYSKLREECKKLYHDIILFVLHAADIANAGKAQCSSLYWADCIREEFFAQGDRERELGLPISPLCDRETVIWHDSQIGFVKFVIRPAFELLGKIIPKVEDDILPSIDNTLKYWEHEKLIDDNLTEDGQCA